MQNNKPRTNGHTTTPPGAELLDATASFIREYLVCDDHQLTILTSWVACTRFQQVFSTAPYLDIHSPESGSGKTSCLILLDGLCDTTFFLTGVPGATVLERFLPCHSLEDPGMGENQRLFTLLLDDCHHTFTGSERQPALVLLNSGSECHSFFPWGENDYYFFGPKAFASNAPLPRSLAARCIPIALRRAKPSEKFDRSLPGMEESRDIRRGLEHWAKSIRPALAEAAHNQPAQLPLTLSPIQRRCIEPLLHIADFAGGAWPARARAAAVAVFNLAETSPHLQMLWDVRTIFRAKDDPEYLPTADLLSELRRMDARPWSEWGPKSGKRLGSHLRPFGISSQHFNRSEGQFYGYARKDFQDAWERYLSDLSTAVRVEELPALPAPASRGSAAEVAAPCDGNTPPEGTEMPSIPRSITEISAIGAD
jgi:hypothetical protein